MAQGAPVYQHGSSLCQSSPAHPPGSCESCPFHAICPVHTRAGHTQRRKERQSDTRTGPALKLRTSSGHSLRQLPEPAPLNVIYNTGQYILALAGCTSSLVLPSLFPSFLPLLLRPLPCLSANTKGLRAPCFGKVKDQRKADPPTLTVQRPGQNKLRAGYTKQPFMPCSRPVNRAHAGRRAPCRARGFGCEQTDTASALIKVSVPESGYFYISHPTVPSVLYSAH